jgi:hypothetical protein
MYSAIGMKDWSLCKWRRHRLALPRGFRKLLGYAAQQKNSRYKSAVCGESVSSANEQYGCSYKLEDLLCRPKISRVSKDRSIRCSPEPDRERDSAPAAKIHFKVGSKDYVSRGLFLRPRDL